MRFHESPSRRIFSGFAAAALIAGGVVATAMAPATAVSGTLSYTCDTSLGDRTFTAVIDTNLPEAMAPGESFTPEITATVTVHPEIANSLGFFGYDSASGTSQATSFIDGVESTIDMTVPATPMAANEPFIVTATGTAPDPVVAGADGDTITATAGNFTSTLTFTGPGADDLTQEVECLLDEGQDATVDVVQVAAVDDGGEDPAPGDGDDTGTDDADAGDTDTDGDETAGGTGNAAHPTVAPASGL